MLCPAGFGARSMSSAYAPPRPPTRGSGASKSYDPRVLLDTRCPYQLGALVSGVLFEIRAANAPRSSNNQLKLRTRALGGGVRGGAPPAETQSAIYPGVPDFICLDMSSAHRKTRLAWLAGKSAAAPRRASPRGRHLLTIWLGSGAVNIAHRRISRR
eukprot:scaffold91420_cov38-Phaeocystis_antarctica.AAC.1